MPNLGAVHREIFLTIDNPLNPPGGVGPIVLIFFKVRLSIRTCVPNLGAVHSDGAVRRSSIYNRTKVRTDWSESTH